MHARRASARTRSEAYARGELLGDGATTTMRPALVIDLTIRHLFGA
ncbi:hypothetical protein [Streptomyces spiralis]